MLILLILTALLNDTSGQNFDREECNRFQQPLAIDCICLETILAGLKVLQ